MPTTVISGLDALTGPTVVGTLTNCSDSAVGTMGMNITGTDSESGSIITGQLKTKFIGPPGGYSIEMQIDFDNAIIQIPTNAQIYRVQIIAQTDYSVVAHAIWNRSGGVASGQATGGVDAALSGGGIFTPTTVINVTGESFDENTGGDVGISFNKSGSVSDSPQLERDFVFEPASSNPDAPLGYISRTQLVALFTDVSIVGACSLFTSVQTGLGGGTYDVGGTVELQINLWEMRVFWNDGITYQWTLEQPTERIQQGIPINVTSDPEDENPLDFTQIDSVTLNYGVGQTIDVPPELWLVITPNSFQFLIPELIGGPGIIIITITGTQFSGSVTLGKLVTIFFLNATGIYRLIPGKSNDTIYDNENGGTMDIKIPNPIFKTGYIGG